MKTSIINNSKLGFKNLTLAILATFTFSTLVIANNLNHKSLPDLNNSKIYIIDSVGDILGDSGEIGILVRDNNGIPVKNVAVQLQTESGNAYLINSFGVTDNNGYFKSLIYSKSMTVAVVSGTIDTNDDGEVDSKIFGNEHIAFIDNLALNNGVGINIDNPDNSAVLHVFSNDRGVLIPRVALQGCSDKVTILDPALSLLVFNTQSSDSLKVGYVYFDGTDWRNFIFE